MLRDNVHTKFYLTLPDTGEILPVPIYVGHPVTLNPTNDPKYIDGQVADILVEIEGEPIEPFIEGAPIGTIEQQHPCELVFNEERTTLDHMSASVWAAHHALPRAARRHSYTTDRGSYRFTWQPRIEGNGFTVRRIA